VRAPLIGVLVGGAARRMGGFPKGNLQRDGRTLLDRTLEACARALAQLPPPSGPLPICLVGESSAYAPASFVSRLEDDPPGRGPMGGLRALLHEAARHDRPALALACDLPFLTVELLERALSESPGAPLLAPRQEGRWQPLFARYDHRAVLPVIESALVSDRTSLQVIFDSLGTHAVELTLSEAEHSALRDWDGPSDMFGGCPNTSR
jgi:molybdenum cofactor guanylyltransferase